MFKEQSLYTQGEIEPDYILQNKRGKEIPNPAQRKHVLR